MSGGIGGTYADGLGTLATFNMPCDVAVNSYGNMVVSDSGYNRIRLISPAGKIVK